MNEIAQLSQLLERAARYLCAARSDATRRAYISDWKGWVRWTAAHHTEPLPADPSALALYLADLAPDHRPSTLRRLLATLATVHRAEGFQPPGLAPEVREMMRGIARTHGIQPRRVQPLLLEDLRAMFAQDFTQTPRSIRDRALVLVGWSLACRESELVALDLSDLRSVPRGLEVLIRRGKADQEGEGRLVPVPFGRFTATCPVLAWNAWRSTYASLRGLPLQGDSPAFISLRDRRRGTGRFRPLAPTPGERLAPRAVEDTVRRQARRAHLDARFGGHSLRSGFATSAASAGVPDRIIMAVTGHRSRATLDAYVRRGQLWDGIPQLL